MADKTINDLTAATSLSSGDLLEIENTSNNSRKITAANAKNYMSSWTVAGSWTWSTNVTEVDFTGLGSYNEIMFVARGVTASASGVRILRVSVDGGSSYYSASGDYQGIGNDGADNASTGFSHSTSSTAARTLVVHIVNTKGTYKMADVHTTTSIRQLFVASSSDINAVRFTNSAGGNLTAGTIMLLAR